MFLSQLNSIRLEHVFRWVNQSLSLPNVGTTDLRYLPNRPSPVTWQCIFDVLQKS